ncbi:MAG: hypothetical protein RJA19_681 [Bacteroidota bacterium]
MQMDRLVRALSFPTVTGAHAELEALGNFLTEAFPRVHAGLEWERVGGHTRVYRWRGSRSGEEGVLPELYVSHMDVVPAGDAGAWSRSPWGERSEGRIYGRGAIDVKCGMMGILEAVEGLLEGGWQPERDVWVVLGHDEETGGAEGAAAVAARFVEQGVRLGCVWDEGGAIVENPMGEGVVAAVGVAEKGWVDVRVVARGTGGHASLAAKFNPLAELSRRVARLPEWVLPREIPAAGLGLVRALSAGRPLQAAGIRLGAALAPRVLHRALARNRDVRTQVATLVTPTLFTAGHAANAVPDRAEVVLNCRIAPGMTRAEVVGWVRSRFPAPDYEVEAVGGSEPSPTVDPRGEAFGRLRGVVEEMGLACKTVPMVFIGITDSRHYLPCAETVLRFVPVRLTAANRSGIHGIDEHIEESNYLEIIGFYERMLRKSGVV